MIRAIPATEGRMTNKVKVRSVIKVLIVSRFCELAIIVLRRKRLKGSNSVVISVVRVEE